MRDDVTKSGKTGQWILIKQDTKRFINITSDSSLQHLKKLPDFPGGSVVKNLPANAGDTGSFLGQGRSHISQGS